MEREVFELQPVRFQLGRVAAFLIAVPLAVGMLSLTRSIGGDVWLPTFLILLVAAPALLVLASAPSKPDRIEVGPDGIDVHWPQSDEVERFPADPGTTVWCGLYHRQGWMVVLRRAGDDGGLRKRTYLPVSLFQAPQELDRFLSALERGQCWVVKDSLRRYHRRLQAWADVDGVSSQGPDDPS